MLLGQQQTAQLSSIANVCALMGPCKPVSQTCRTSCHAAAAQPMQACVPLALILARHADGSFVGAVELQLVGSQVAATECSVCCSRAGLALLKQVGGSTMCAPQAAAAGRLGPGQRH